MRASGKSAGERRKRDMQAFWIFVIQNDSYKMETKLKSKNKQTKTIQDDIWQRQIQNMACGKKPRNAPT